MKRKSLTAFCFFYLLFATAGILRALDPGLSLSQYTVDFLNFFREIPQSTVNAITQTRDGYTWIGTQEGLARFNGIKFVVFDKKKVPELKSNYINCLFEDSQGTLWIGTNRGTLTMKNGKFQRVGPENRWYDNRVRSICEDKSGSVWIGLDGGLKQIKNGKISLYSFSEGLTIEEVLRVYPDSKNNLWLISSNGELIRFSEGKFTPFPHNLLLPNTIIQDIHEDHAGNLWIGTANHALYQYKDGKLKRFASKEGFRPRRVTILHEDIHHNLWIGTFGDGLWCYRDGEFLSFPKGTFFEKGMIYSLYEDNESNLWVGTESNGFARLRASHFVNYSGPEGLHSININSVYSDKDGNTWIGSRDSLLYKLKDKKISSIEIKINGKPVSDMMSIAVDDQKNLWLGTYSDGLIKLKENRFTQYDFPGLKNSQLNFIYLDRSGLMWIGTSLRGLFTFKNGKLSPYPMAVKYNVNNIHALQESHKGGIWIGTMEKGIFYFNENRMSVFNSQNGLSDNSVLSIYEDENGVLFAGTFNGGLNRIHDGRITVFSTDNGLFNDSIYAIVEDRYSNLWMSSNKGIFRVNKYELEDFASGKTKGYRCISYDESDGMRNRECNGGFQPAATTDTEGNIWFSTIKGIVGINPNHLKENMTSPPVLIEKILIDGKATYISDKKKQLRFSPEVRTIEFHYTSIDYSNPDRTQFKYYLYGYNSKWENVGNRRTVNFVNLPSGSYRFLVTASNNYGVWNPKGDFFDFYIEPHVHDTWWFYAVGIGIFFLITYSIFRFRTRLLRKREMELERLVEVRTQQLEIANALAYKEKIIAEQANQSKSHFLARMSHEIRTPMNGILGFIEMMKNSGLNEEQMDYALTISRSGEALLSLLNDILDFSKIEAGELTFDPIDFDPEITAFDVCDIIIPRIGEKPVEVLCRIGEQVPAYVYGDAGRFRQVLVNLMGNASKFTEKGEIELTIDIEEEENERIKFHITVRDTGIGIPQDRIENIFEMFRQSDGSISRKYGGTGLGLSICRQIAAMMEGKVWATSELGKGSIFHFTAWMKKSDKQPDKGISPVSLERKHVLIVDDNKRNLEILSFILEHEGLNVTIACSGEEVFPLLEKKLAEEIPIHICIIDIQLPGISGYDVARGIRKLNPPLGNIPLMAYSSSSLDRPGSFIEFGFNGFLMKPSPKFKILKMIESLLQIKDPTSIIPEKPPKTEIATELSITEQAKRSIHILLAEDNPVNQKLASYLLKKAGYTITTAENGEIALKIFLENPRHFDLIFMDIQMPYMDGLEATRQIRKNGFTDIPIIAMTAESMKGDKEKCLEAGMNDYISKPIRRDEVFHMVKKFCFKSGRHS